jgi:hypothetical protein
VVHIFRDAETAARGLIACACGRRQAGSVDDAGSGPGGVISCLAAGPPWR